uniref:Solute carrier family 5 member 8 n=1 Tax=Myripristis murdjan TaxID=586833 RepID=A0A668A1F9_9TELE
MPVGSFVAVDYVVFALMLLVSAAIGVYYAWADRSQSSTGDFLIGGRRLTAVPVSLSLTASFMSAITVLASPAEVYRYGAIFGLMGFSYTMTVLVTSEVFLPVFYKLAITSTYEYLELRFNRATRLVGTLFFIFQTILYTGIVIYTPALALNQVTGMDLWGAVISTGVVCTFYCTMVCTKPAFLNSVGIMLAGFLSVIIRSVLVQGGVLNIVSDSHHGGRLNFWDFDMNPLRRHTFWTLTIGGTFIWVSVYGINQAQVQRYISCKSLANARLSLYLNLIGLLVIVVCTVFAGLCLYSIYKNCDPWTAGLVSKPDQLMPYLAMDILRVYPGLPGLFVAAAYSGSLSTVSSSINALAAVTVEDLIKPHIHMSEKRLSWISKGLSECDFQLTADLCLLMQAASSIFGIIGGPLLGLFTLGILFPFANSTGALSGLVSGLTVSLWLGIGAQIFPAPPEMTRPLLLTTEGCNFTATDSLNWTSPALPTEQLHQKHKPPLADSWYSLSYLYFSPIGTTVAVTVGLIVSLFTGIYPCLQQFCMFTMCFSGGMKLKTESNLTLTKEDMMSYHLFRFFKERVSATELNQHRNQECVQRRNL